MATHHRRGCGPTTGAARRLAWTVAAAAALSAGVAQAHTPYLLPNTFDASSRDHVTVQASFAEDLFRPEVVMRSEGWSITGPDGQTRPLTPTYLRDMAVLEAPTPADGAYRISSGVRKGRVAKAVLVKDEWVIVGEGREAPAGATPVDMQSITRADVYVSRKGLDRTALKPTGQGLEFEPVTHPSEITVGQPARFVALLDGKPLPRQQVQIERGDGRYDGAKPVEVTTGADGAFAFTPPAPGVYLAMARHRIAPAAAGQPAQSLTYTLTFEADR